jgi:hypothetical protein
MAQNENGKKISLSSKGIRDLRMELFVVLPFFLMCLIFFIGSLQYKKGAGILPMLASATTGILTGMRLFHIIFPKSKIGEFKEAGLAGEFDHIKEKIEEDTLLKKDHYEKPKEREITFQDEKKAFLGAIGCFVAYLLFGYIVGCFLVIIGGCYYYGYKSKLPIAVVLVSMFIIVYVILHKMFEAPADFGILLGPVLKSLHMIR